MRNIGCSVPAEDEDYDYGSELQAEFAVREVAIALAEAVTSATVSCQTSGGPETKACAMSEGTITAVAQAQVGFPSGIADYLGLVFQKLPPEDLNCSI